MALKTLKLTMVIVQLIKLHLKKLPIPAPHIDNITASFKIISLNIFLEAPNTLKTAISFFLSLNIAVKLILKTTIDNIQIAPTKTKILVDNTLN